MDVENGKCVKSVLGTRKKWGNVLQCRQCFIQTCFFAPFVLEKEGIASSRRNGTFILIALSPVSLLSTFGSFSVWCFGNETLLPELLIMENTENQWNLQLLLIQTTKIKFIPLWWRGPAGLPVHSFASPPPAPPLSCCGGLSCLTVL